MARQFTNRDIDIARHFHETTKHSYASIRSDQYSLDWDNRPLPYKIYPEAGALALPRDIALSSVPTLAALRGQIPTAEDMSVDVAMAARLLFCCGGLTRRVSVGGQDYHFRAAASAGALYPIEMYLAAAEVEGLEPGLYHFSPADLKLHGLRRGDWRPYLADAAAGQGSLSRAGAVLIMSAIFWRSAWKYRARSYRYCFWDAGTVLANLLAATNAEALKAEIVTSFEDARLEELIGVDGDREGVVCMVALGRSLPASGKSPELGPLNLETIPLSASESNYDELIRLHDASSLVSAEEVIELASARLSHARVPDTSTVIDTIKPEALKPDSSISLGGTILRRGSTRQFAREPIEAPELAAILASNGGALEGDGSLIHTYLIINAVSGIASGAYYYHRDTGKVDLLKRGEFRWEAGYLALEQALGADCSALIVYMADLEVALRLRGNRGYRDVHLEAGSMGGRSYLAAYALQRGASGLTFYDDDTSEFFAPHASGLSPLLMVAVGVPATRSVEGDANTR
jgi:SagB-type dehydrogenase family enzyme